MMLRLSPLLLLCACATATPAVTPAPPPVEAAPVDAGVVEAPPPPPPTRESLLAAAAATKTLLAAGSGYATHSVHVAGATEIIVEQVFDKDVRRIDFAAARGEQKQRLATIIARPGRWEVRTAKDQAEVTRPWEALLPIPTLYYLLQHSTIDVVDAEFLDHARFVGFEQGHAKYKAPLPAVMRTRLERLVQQLEKSPGETVAARKKELEQVLAEGRTVWVEPESGVIAAVGAPDPTLVQSVAPVKQQPASLFDVGVQGEPPAAPVAAALGDTVITMYQPGYRPDRKPGDMDVVLLDVTTGKVRRVPLVDAIGSPGSFLPGRKQLVTTASVSDGFTRPVIVDLATGANRFPGGTALAPGAWMFPVASRDGKKIAVSLMSEGDSVLDSQLYVINLETDEVTKVGGPMDLAFVTWLPRGDGFLVLHRVPVEGQKEPKNTISRMSLSGELTPIIEGENPVLLGDGKTILYADAERLWRTCRLDGKGAKPFGDGFKGYGMPTPSPDGKRLLMMHYVDGAVPQPVVVDLKTKAVHDVPGTSGLFAWPAWR